MAPDRPCFGLIDLLLGCPPQNPWLYTWGFTPVTNSAESSRRLQNAFPTPKHRLYQGLCHKLMLPCQCAAKEKVDFQNTNESLCGYHVSGYRRCLFSSFHVQSTLPCVCVAQLFCVYTNLRIELAN